LIFSPFFFPVYPFLLIWNAPPPFNPMQPLLLAARADSAPYCLQCGFFFYEISKTIP